MRVMRKVVYFWRQFFPETVRCPVHGKKLAAFTGDGKPVCPSCRMEPIRGDKEPWNVYHCSEIGTWPEDLEIKRF